MTAHAEKAPRQGWARVLIRAPVIVLHHTAFNVLQLIAGIANRLIGVVMTLLVLALPVVWFGLAGMPTQGKALWSIAAAIAAAAFVQVVIAVLVALCAPRSLQQHKEGK